MVKIFAPSYIKDFLCIASACPRTCCSRWTVTMDKEKYEKLLSCPDDLMRESFEENIVKFQDKARYARVKFNEEGNCPYLNEDLLCNIQLRLGEPYLPNACAYPRRAYLINGNWEQSMVLSCPVSADDTLFNPEKMKFEEFEAEKPELYVKFDCDYGYEKFKTVRDFMIEIIQDRTSPFWIRLLFLGIFIKRVYNADFDKTIDGIDSFKNYIKQNEQAERFYNIKPDYAEQFALISYMLEETSKRPPVKEYGELLADCAIGLNKADTGKADGYINVTQGFQEYLNEIDLVFENYFANEIFKAAPAVCGLYENERGEIEKDGERLFKTYLEWCALYRLNYFQFACLFNYLNVLDENNIVAAVNLTCRATTTHDKTFFDALTKHMLENGYEDVDKIAELIAG